METLLNHLSQSLSGNPFLAYLGVFVGGILSSSSPCVLATIPLVIGYVSGYSGGNRRKGLTLFSHLHPRPVRHVYDFRSHRFLYRWAVWGTGRTWYFLVGGIAIAIGLQLIGLYEWNLPIPVQFQSKQRGMLGAFFLGLILRYCFFPMCYSSPRSHPNFRRLKRRCPLRDLLVICLRNCPLCTHLS